MNSYGYTTLHLLGKSLAPFYGCHVLPLAMEDQCCCLVKQFNGAGSQFCQAPDCKCMDILDVKTKQNMIKRNIRVFLIYVEMPCSSHTAKFSILKIVETNKEWSINILFFHSSNVILQMGCSPQKQVLPNL